MPASGTGEGKTRESGQRTTVYRRVVDNNYNLKSKTSRSLLVEVHRRFSALPFSLRALVPHMEKGEVGVRAGVLEPSQHEMLQAFPVLEEKEESALVAHSKITALMLPGGTLRVTGRELLAYIRSDKKREHRADGEGGRCGSEQGCAHESQPPPLPVRVCSARRLGGAARDRVARVQEEGEEGQEGGGRGCGRGR